MSANATIPAEDISSLTEAQDKALALIGILPALLSIWGSSNIVYMVATSKKTTPYRRILFGLSCCDILSSFVNPWHSFLVPADTSPRVWAIGNDATCSALGFFQQFSFSNSWYAGALSLYFLFTVRYGIKDQQFAQKYETPLHILCIGYPLITALIGAGMGVYNEFRVGNGCWVYDYPNGCGCNPEDGPDGVCCLSIPIAWVFGGIPNMIIFLVILVSNMLVYLHVRQTITRSRQYLHSSVGATASNQINQQQMKRVQAVATQAFLYVAAFFVCVLPAATTRVLEMRFVHAEDEAQIFPLLVIQGITYPLQGFLNVFIYIRPSFLKVRKEFPEQTRFWAFRRAMYGNKVQERVEVSFMSSMRFSFRSAASSRSGKRSQGAADDRRANLIREFNRLEEEQRQQEKEKQNAMETVSTGFDHSTEFHEDDGIPSSHVVEPSAVVCNDEPPTPCHAKQQDHDDSASDTGGEAEIPTGETDHPSQAENRGGDTVPGEDGSKQYAEDSATGSVWEDDGPKSDSPPTEST